MKTTPGRYLVLHPLLFGLFPVLFLFAENAQEMRSHEVVWPLILVVLLGLGGTILLGVLMRSFQKAGLVMSAFLVLFLSYGHVVNLLPGFRFSLGETVIGPNGVVFPIWVVLFIVAVRKAAKTKKDLSNITRLLTIIAAVLVGIQLVRLALISATVSGVDVDRKVETSLESAVGYTPDLYYVIVDGYGRSDILQEFYKYDNSELISFLKERGFYVADSSCSNYPQTLLSLSTSMNLGYIQDWGDFDRGSNDRTPLAERLWNNEVFDIFRNIGYSIVAFASGYSITEFEDAECYLTPTWTVSEYQNILLSTTPIPLFLSEEKSSYAMHRRRMEYIFDKLPRMYEFKQPFFAIAHIAAPHPPFVFDADGRAIQPDRPFGCEDGSHFMNTGATREEYIVGYKAQAKYITSRLRETIEGILDRYADQAKPIIVIQGDHGPGSELSWTSCDSTTIRERFSILNAMYLPGGKYEAVYPEISSVNTFRLILNEYFGGEYELLPDRCFYATWAHPYAYREVTDRERSRE